MVRSAVAQDIVGGCSDDCGHADDHPGVSVQFKILRVQAEAAPPASPNARRRGCTCPVRENRAGGGWDVSENDTLKGFWIDEACEIHRAKLGPAR
jgi:hypothetical protein